jgi:hypothetical protein
MGRQEVDHDVVKTMQKIAILSDFTASPVILVRGNIMSSAAHHKALIMHGHMCVEQIFVSYAIGSKI